MKRCPQCNRVESDDALVYCRVDGTSLVSDVGLDSSDAGSSPVSSESETSILPNLSVDPPTAQTTVLPPERLKVKTNQLTKPNRRRFVILLLAVLFAGVIVAGYFHFSRKNNRAIESIAVMPFVNESGNADVEYLSDGMTETLISSLSQLENLSVKPRSSVFRYKGKTSGPQEIGRDLGVQAVLLGRVVQRGDELSLFVELIDVIADKVVWSQRYNRKQSDLVVLQSEIAQDVSKRLKPNISGSDAVHVAKTYTASPEAYQHYLKGNYHRLKWTEDGYMKAIEHYNRAIQIDPTYGLAYTGLALAHFVAVDWFVPPIEAAPRVKAAATKALEIDSSLADAHVALGQVALWCDWDWPRAEREIKLALERDPNNAAAHQLYGWYYSVLGMTESAISEMSKAQDIEPLNFSIMGDLAFVLILAGRVDEGLQLAKRGVELDNTEWWIRVVVSLGHERKGQMNEALAEINRARAINNAPFVISFVGYILAASGKTAEARNIARELEELSRQRYVSPYFWATVYAALNDRDSAFRLLEKAEQQRSGLAGLGTEWTFEKLRPDPRFNKFMDRLNLGHLKR